MSRLHIHNEYEYVREMIVVIAMLDDVGIIVATVVIVLEVAVSVSHAVDVLSDVVIAVLINELAGVLADVLAGAIIGAVLFAGAGVLTDVKVKFCAVVITPLMEFHMSKILEKFSL